MGDLYDVTPGKPRYDTVSSASELCAAADQLDQMLARIEKGRQLPPEKMYPYLQQFQLLCCDTQELWKALVWASAMLGFIGGAGTAGDTINSRILGEYFAVDCSQQTRQSLYNALLTIRTAKRQFLGQKGGYESIAIHAAWDDIFKKYL